MKSLTTVKGEKVSVTDRELIWNALDFLRSHVSYSEDVYLALVPRREGIRVSSEELIAFIDSVSPKFA